MEIVEDKLLLICKFPGMEEVLESHRPVLKAIINVGDSELASSDSYECLGLTRLLLIGGGLRGSETHQWSQRVAVTDRC